MESFGSYEATREISSGPGRTVFSARKSGAGGSDGFVVKFFPTPADSGAEPGISGDAAVTGEARVIEHPCSRKGYL